MKGSSTVRQQKNAAAAPARKQRILLIESDAAFRHALSKIFARTHWCISSASNLTEAIEYLSQVQFALIIFDLGKASTINFDRLQRILHHAGKSPVLVLMPFEDAAVTEQLQLMGVAATLPKPVKRQTLIGAAEKALFACNQS